MTKYSIRFYNEKTDAEQVIYLLNSSSTFVDMTPDRIRGVAVVAVDDRTDRIVGFFWALAGLASVVYLDYLVVDKGVENKENIWIDLTASMLAVLRECGVKEAIFGVVNPKVQKVLQIIGCETIDNCVAMRANINSVAAIVTDLNKRSDTLKQKEQAEARG